MLKKFSYLSILMIIFITACSSGSYKVPKPLSADKKASALQVVKELDAFIEETELLSLSPDGKWFLGRRLDSICILDATDFTEKVCSSWEKTLDPGSIAWSNDSLRIALTENLAQNLDESDLWIFDISAGTLNNLTNDNLDGDVSSALQRAESSEKEINLDSYPVWSPDGKTIAFIRSVYGDTKQTFLCTIQGSGGVVTKLLNVDETHALAVWHRMRWTLDGKKLVFSINIFEDNTGKNGVWSVNRDGKNSQQLVKTKEGWGSPIMYDVAAKGDKILVGYTQGISQASQLPNLSFFEIYDLNTGTLTPLKQVSSEYDPETASKEFYSPTQAIFSPDGSKILFHYNQPREEGTVPQLVVLDVSSTAENVLVSRPIFVPLDSSLSLFWGENDAIFMMTSAGLGKVYMLGSK